MIRFGFYTPTIALSSDLPDISILTDHDAVDFRLVANGERLLEGRYYANDGYVVVSDISSIIEHFMAGNTDGNFCEIHIEAFVGEDEADYNDSVVTVLYCDKTTGLTDPTDWLSENFLTLTRSRRLAPHSFINLSWYAVENESIMLRVYATYLDDDGRRRTYQYAYSGNGQVAHISGIMSEVILLSSIVDTIRECTDAKNPVLQSVTVRCTKRSATFFIDPALDGIVPFYYLNCFGVPEHISMPRTTTTKIKSDRSVALLGKTAEFYDISHSKEYEVESGPLTADECLQVEQMMTSPAVKIPFGPNMSVYENDFDAMLPILITDFTCEFSDTDEKLNKIKFTWRHSANRPLMDAPLTAGIFDDKFNPTYS